jgi:hypothetical protein
MPNRLADVGQLMPHGYRAADGRRGWGSIGSLATTRNLPELERGLQVGDRWSVEQSRPVDRAPGLVITSSAGIRCRHHRRPRHDNAPMPERYVTRAK